jgi:MFS family permease
MTSQNEDPAADIAWMRRLAEEGSQAPVRGASILMAAGLIFGVASLFHWGQLTDRLGQVPGVIGIGWLVATILFLGVVTIVNLGMRRRTGVMTSANRAFAAAWSAVGFGIFALFVALMINDYRMGPDQGFTAMWLIPSIIFAFYGLGWAVTASMLRSRTLWLLAIASLIACPAMALLTGSTEQYLAYAAALFLLMALPGWMLMRQARA